MNLFTTSSKKIVKIAAAAVAGIFILSGAVLAADSTFKEKRHDRYFKSGPQMQIDHDKAAEKIAATFGLSKEKVTAYQAQGYNLKDLFIAGLFARAADKPYDLVISMKTKENNWKDIAGNLNISREQVRAVKTDLAAGHMSQVLNVSQSVIKDLVQNGYKHRDIMAAGILAKRADKSINDVISLKQINNTWQEVAASLGVSHDDFKNDIRALFAEAGFVPSDKNHSKKPGFKFGERAFDR